jgi:hypothetical protein
MFFRTTRRPNTVRLGVQTLEGRDVPATLNITSVGASASANGALFQQSAAVATDEFDTFLRLRDNNGSSEEGYNTDARPFQFDQRGDLSVTHSLQLSAIPTVTVGDTVYREFLLHVAEGGNPRISLEQLRFFVGETGNLTGYNRPAQTLSGLTAVWDLDAGSNNTVVFRDGLSGAGKGDAVVLIPDSVFVGATDSSFIYLYSRFGNQFDAHGGAEEWGVRSATGGSLSGFVYVAQDIDGIREPNGIPAEDVGIQGVTLHLLLNGTETVVATTVTGQNGAFSFGGLAAGEYTIRRVTDPAGFADQLNQPGVDPNDDAASVEPWQHELGWDLIVNITLGTEQDKGEYNFGMSDASGPPG